jgi:hypothetical protein
MLETGTERDRLGVSLYPFCGAYKSAGEGWHVRRLLPGLGTDSQLESEDTLVFCGLFFRHIHLEPSSAFPSA